MQKTAHLTVSGFPPADDSVMAWWERKERLCRPCRLPYHGQMIEIT